MPNNHSVPWYDFLISLPSQHFSYAFLQKSEVLPETVSQMIRIQRICERLKNIFTLLFFSFGFVEIYNLQRRHLWYCWRRIIEHCCLSRVCRLGSIIMIFHALLWQKGRFNVEYTSQKLGLQENLCLTVWQMCIPSGKMFVNLICWLEKCNEDISLFLEI